MISLSFVAGVEHDGQCLCSDHYLRGINIIPLPSTPLNTFLPSISTLLGNLLVQIPIKMSQDTSPAAPSTMDPELSRDYFDASSSNDLSTDETAHTSSKPLYQTSKLSSKWRNCIFFHQAMGNGSKYRREDPPHAKRNKFRDSHQEPEPVKVDTGDSNAVYRKDGGVDLEGGKSAFVAGDGVGVADQVQNDSDGDIDGSTHPEGPMEPVAFERARDASCQVR
jgi:hypothetical protein